MKAAKPIRADGGLPDTGEASSWPSRSFLGALESSTREELLRLGVRRVFSPGQVFITQGDEATDVFVLLDGVAKVTGAGSAGQLLLLDVQVGGDTVGEMAALDGQPRSATVTAAGSVVAIEIRSDDLLRFFSDNPDASLAMSRMLTRRLGRKSRQVLEFSGFDGRTRLARTLIALTERFSSLAADGDGDELVMDLPVTQLELASLVGISGPTLHKALRDLRSAGAVATRYRQIVITDMAALHRIAQLGDP